MGRSTPPLATDQQGTASMEMLLTLPTVFIFLVLLVDLGSGWLIKIKAEAATRFAGTVYMRAERGVDGRVAAWRALKKHYGALDIRNPQITSRKKPVDSNTVGGPPGWRSITATLAPWLPRLSSSRSVSLVVQRDPPVGTIITSSSLATVFVIDKNPWNYDRIPLSIKALLDRATDLDLSAQSEASALLPGPLLSAFKLFAVVLGSVAKILLWPLGIYP